MIFSFFSFELQFCGNWWLIWFITGKKTWKKSCCSLLQCVSKNVGNRKNDAFFFLKSNQPTLILLMSQELFSKDFPVSDFASFYQQIWFLNMYITSEVKKAEFQKGFMPSFQFQFCHLYSPTFFLRGKKFKRQNSRFLRLYFVSFGDVCFL